MGKGGAKRRDPHVKKQLILDNGSTMGSITMVENVRLAKNPILMSMNAGTKAMNLEADLYGFGTVFASGIV